MTHTVAELVTYSVFFPHSKYHEMSQKDGKQVNIPKKGLFSFPNLNNRVILRKASVFGINFLLLGLLCIYFAPYTLKNHMFLYACQ